MLTRTGIWAVLKRVSVLAVFTAGLILAPDSNPAVAVAFLGVAVGLYAVFPLPGHGPGALRYGRMQAVVIPDWLGFVLTGLMIALPFWAAETGAAHPSAWLCWPMALFFASLIVVGWHYDCRAVTIRDAALEIETGRQNMTLPYASIARVAPWRRGLPKWLRALAPLTLSLGSPGTAGAIMLARDSSGFALERAGGRPVVIPADAFRDGARAILAACMAHGVPVAPGLSHLKPAA